MMGNSISTGSPWPVPPLLDAFHILLALRHAAIETRQAEGFQEHVLELVEWRHRPYSISGWVKVLETTGVVLDLHDSTVVISYCGPICSACSAFSESWSPGCRHDEEVSTYPKKCDGAIFSSSHWFRIETTMSKHHPFRGLHQDLTNQVLRKFRTSGKCKSKLSCFFKLACSIGYGMLWYLQIAVCIVEIQPPSHSTPILCRFQKPPFCSVNLQFTHT